MVAVVAIAGMVVAVTGCAGRGQTVETERVVNVKVQTITASGDANSKTYVGTVSPSKSTVLTSRYPGTLVSLKGVQGQRVAKGDVLAVVEAQSVQSSLEIAKARLEQARDGYERLKKVYASGSVPEVRMVEIETQLAEAEASFKIAQQALDDCTITAPYSGVVSDVYAEEGTEIGLAEPLLRVIDANSLEISIPVPENEIGGVTVGKGATMTVPALNDKVIGCRVTKKGVSASPLSHSYECTLVPASDDGGLMPGMVCKVRLSGEGEEKMVIPASAVKTGAEGRYVWVVEDGKAKRVNIAVDGFSGTGVVVTEGLAVGDELIVSGAQKVSSGMRVNVVE